jgi:hypothetical protein
MPFLSAHVIEDLEAAAQKEAEARLRDFLKSHLSSQERRGIKVIAQREFVSEGLDQHLRTDRYDLLGVGGIGENPSDEGIGFHARYFIRQASIPVLIAFPQGQTAWQRMLLVHDASFNMAQKAKVRRLLRRLQIPCIGLPVVHLANLQKQHRHLQKLVAPLPYAPFLWQGTALIELLLQAAASSGADVIGVLMAPEGIIQGMQALPPSQLKGSPAWLFFPEASVPTAEEHNE